MNEYKLIYILGTSYCGSTILGYILGSIPEVFDAGELKFYNRLQAKGGEICSCGVNSLQCPFWKNIYNENYSIYETSSNLEIANTICKILFGKKIKKTKHCHHEYQLLKCICSSLNNNTQYILDASKSLWRLQYLLTCSNINVKIIYLRRSIEGNVSSFKKHNKSFINATLTYKLNNILIKRYLKTNKLDHIKIEYNELCHSTNKVLKRVEQYLGVNYGNYKKNIRNREYHVPSGNYGTRKQFLTNFNGLSHDDSWKKRLNSIEKAILKIIK